jgi:DNA polymerase-4
MDAFYASVEQRDRPELRGRPVVVGADPRGRGVVAAASYEARRFGVRSAMPIREAHARCPHAAFVPVDMERYARASAEVMAILGSVTPLVEPLSLDEAFLDVTGSAALLGPPAGIARHLKGRIRAEVGLTASAGVAPNKFLAKIASDLDKPDGLRVVEAGEEAAFLRDLPLGRLWGVGPVTERALHGLGIRTIGELAALPPGALRARLGAAGAHLQALARGRDDRPVVPWQDPKSIGAEETFERDTRDEGRLRSTLFRHAERVAAELRAQRYRGGTVTLKLRFDDFQTLTRRGPTPEPTADAGVIFARAWEALQRVPRVRAVRLIGLSVSGLIRDGGPWQLSLFGGSERADRLAQVTDALRARFGPGAVRRASLLGAPGPRGGPPGPRPARGPGGAP